MNTNHFKVSLAISAICLMAACGDHDHDHEGHDHGGHNHGEGEHSAAEEGCEHMKEGPAESITAVADAMSSPPAVTDDHKRFDITLVESEGMNVGVVSFSADEAGEFVVFMNGDIPLTVTAQSDEQSVSPEGQGEGVAECAEIITSQTFDLELGTYLLTFGPTSDTEVQIVIEHAGDHAGE